MIGCRRWRIVLRRRKSRTGCISCWIGVKMLMWMLWILCWSWVLCLVLVNIWWCGCVCVGWNRFWRGEGRSSSWSISDAVRAYLWLECLLWGLIVWWVWIWWNKLCRVLLIMLSWMVWRIVWWCILATDAISEFRARTGRRTLSSWIF